MTRPWKRAVVTHITYTSYGSIEWHRSNNIDIGPFRSKGPCQIDIDGMLRFSQLTHLSYSRLKGPVLIYPNGGLEFNSSISADGELHRTDGPARILSNGTKLYYVHNKPMSTDEFFLKYGVL